MNRIKNFFMENQMIATAVALVLLIVLIIVAAVTPLGDKVKVEKATKDRETTLLTENNSEEETTLDITTAPEKETLETESSDNTTDDTNEETTSEEETTEPVDPADYPYIIKVNRVANCTTVYGKDANGQYTVPVKAITVSCGKNLEDTPLGEFNTIISYDWRLMFDDTYGHYAYRIVGSTLFHSVPYYTASNDDLEWTEYNKLGSAASMGCVRMTVADAKWLVENCPVGTKVIIYDDASNPGPLGKPETIKIPANSPYKGWDPTDPNPNNPWHQCSASITYPSSRVITVDQGSTDAKIRSFFTAKDTCGNVVTNKIKITGQYNLNVPGTYNNIIIGITDALGSHAEVSVTIVVKAKDVTIPTTTEKPSETEEDITTEDETETTIEQETTEIEDTTEKEETSEEETTENEEETTSEMESELESITTEMDENNED